MKTYIDGIPCLIDYTIVGKYSPAKTDTTPDHCYPAEYPDIDFIVCDLRWRPAPWLERKMTHDDIQRIETEILEQA